MFLGIFQQIAPALNWCIEICIEQEKHVPQLKEPQLVKIELNILPALHFNCC
jgi:hypothetical protein